MTRTRLFAVLVAAALVASACGARDDDESSTATTAPTATTVASDGPSDEGVTDTQINVGASATLSGPTGFLGDEVVGSIKAWFETLNAKGGINGRKLNFVVYDDRGDPTQVLANFRRLVEQDHVVAMVTGFADNALDYLDSIKMPTIVFGVSPSSFASKYPTIYPVVGNALLWTQEFIAGIKDQKLFKPGMKVAMIYDDTLIDISPYLPFLKDSWTNAGAEVVAVDPYTLASGSCDSLVLKYRDMGVDWLDFQSAAWFLCVQSADRQGWKPNVGWGDWPSSVPGIATIAGPLVAGVWGGSNGDQPDGAPREKTEAHAEFLTALQTYAPNLTKPEHLDSPATLGYWGAAKLLTAALEEQGKQITKAGLNSWIQKVKNFEVGVTPPIISMAPTCKTGSELIWIAPWQWDAFTNTAFRKATTKYYTSPQKDKFGGKCFLTKISDEIAR